MEEEQYELCLSCNGAGEDKYEQICRTCKGKGVMK
jgi:DnaJ-class molecular chaperone